MIVSYDCKLRLPVVGHNKHCPGEAYDTPENLKQHELKDIELLPTASPSQPVELKQTGAIDVCKIQ